MFRHLRSSASSASSSSGEMIRRRRRSPRRARVKAGMPHVNFHDLRHSCASIMLVLGVDLYTISKILGHANVQTPQRYAHLQVAAQRLALDKLSALVVAK